jgi:2-polyprenyl-3-methyl-5-hydroxy-6-metoxy-1,4-benzoquinol methylase|tara:strand:+ start:47 stop:1261 length:1215 start_codon:yes stop_codon:yes gene_type:complete
MKYKSRLKCLCCGKTNLSEIINLGKHSFADRFIPKKKLKKKDPVFPLVLDLCKNCKFIQSRSITNPKSRYIDLDYSYTSANSEYSRNHWLAFTNALKKKNNLRNKKIIEIGSNDGFLCSILRKEGANVIGVDASNFMVQISKQRKIKSIHSIFNFRESKKIKRVFGTADIIIANNVFNHSNEPSDFLKGVYNLLKRNGIFIFEQPNFTEGALSLKFDQIYHEHISYFTVKNINSILNYNNFKINHLEKNSYHGGSLKTVAIKKSSKLQEYDISEFLKFEKLNNIYKVSYYKKMMSKIYIKKEKLLKKLNNLVKKDYIIAGIGAGAKSNTLLTFYNLDNKIVNFLTDSSKYKQNKYTPVTRILIKDDKEIKKYKKITCIILSWNISKIVVNKIKKLNSSVKILYT